MKLKTPLTAIRQKIIEIHQAIKRFFKSIWQGILSFFKLFKKLNIGCLLDIVIVCLLMIGFVKSIGHFDKALNDYLAEIVKDTNQDESTNSNLRQNLICRQILNKLNKQPYITLQQAQHLFFKAKREDKQSVMQDMNNLQVVDISNGHVYSMVVSWELHGQYSMRFDPEFQDDSKKPIIDSNWAKESANERKQIQENVKF